MSACTNKQLFNSIQSNAKNQCEREPNQKTRTECLNDAKQNYRDYKRERDQLLSKDDKP